MANRPISVLTVQSEAPPPYSEYDATTPPLPEPNAETQALLRGGYLLQNNQRTPQQSLVDESPAAVYIRQRSYTGRHDNVITVARAIHPSIKVDGIPFPNEYPAVASRDVKPEDWIFFANCIVDELEVPAPKGSVPTPLSLNEFRERQSGIDVVVELWNRGFFAPRGIHIVAAYSYGRASSPTPTYRTEQTANVSEAAEIETVTFDTSPRSTRAPTPDTVRELELENENNGGRTTPTAERASFVPTITKPDGTHFQSSMEREFQEQLYIDEQLRQQRLAGAGFVTGPAHSTDSQEKAGSMNKEKLRRYSSNSSSISLSSIDSISSDDELANGDVSAIRKTLAEEFRRDPKDMKHLKAALVSIRGDIKQQHNDMAKAQGKLQRKNLQSASKEHRKAMRAEMKELRREMKSYHKIAKIHTKDERDAKKQQRKQLRDEAKSTSKYAKDTRKESRKSGKADRRARKHGKTPGDGPNIDLVPVVGQTDREWRDAIPGGSPSWPFGKKSSGLPEQELPKNMPPGWPFGGELPGWPWNNTQGNQSHYPKNWPLEEKPPGWPLNKTQSAPVIRKPVPPRRPSAPSPTSPYGSSGQPGPSNAPAPAAPYGSSGDPGPSNAPAPAPAPPAAYGSHLSPTGSYPARSAARAASRTPSPSAAAPTSQCPTDVLRSWGARGRGGRPGADWSGGRGRGFRERPGTGDSGMSTGFGLGRGRDRGDSLDSGRGRGRGRGMNIGGRAGDDGLLGMARGYLMQQVNHSFERLRPAPGMDHGPAQRAGSSPAYNGPIRHDDDGQETGVASR